MRDATALKMCPSEHERRIREADERMPEALRDVLSPMLPGSFSPPKHPNTANQTPQYQIRRKEKRHVRKSANHVCIALARGAL